MDELYSVSMIAIFENLRLRQSRRAIRATPRTKGTY